MIFTILLALSGLILSAVAIYYSVLGLTAIFAAAFWPIVVMGTTLEVSKLVAASWLKAKWNRIPFFMKTYMMISVLVLMLITSMGIFGFLSKAHTDQTLVSGDVQSRIALYDEKINTERENIDAARRALKQMDEAVDQVMARSTSEQGAGRAAQLRRQQQAERTRLQKDITTAQSNISRLQSERAPIAAEVRKVEAEVGPIKYIAKFIYGENSDTNLLEKAVTWVIVTIIFVFDPLAILMILASQMSYQWWKEEKLKKAEQSKKEEPFVNEAKEDTDATANDNNDNAHDSRERNEPRFSGPVTPVVEPVQPNNEDNGLSEIKQEDPVEQWNEMIEAAEKAVSEEKQKTAEVVVQDEQKQEIQRSDRIYDPEEIQKILRAKADNVPTDDTSDPKKKLT
jgi:hypothetical protein